MTEVVVDASVSLKWFVPEPDTDIAVGLLRSATKVHAPRFLAIETANAAWKNWRKQLIAIDIVRSVGDRLPKLVDVWHSDEGLLDEALEMAVTLSHPIFDCLYLVLAKQRGLQVVTTDRRMLDVAVDGTAIALVNWRP